MELEDVTFFLEQSITSQDYLYILRDVVGPELNIFMDSMQRCHKKGLGTSGWNNNPLCKDWSRQTAPVVSTNSSWLWIWCRVAPKITWPDAVWILLMGIFEIQGLCWRSTCRLEKSWKNIGRLVDVQPQELSKVCWTDPVQTWANSEIGGHFQIFKC